MRDIRKIAVFILGVVTDTVAGEIENLFTWRWGDISHVKYGRSVVDFPSLAGRCGIPV